MRLEARRALIVKPRARQVQGHEAQERRLPRPGVADQHDVRVAGEQLGQLQVELVGRLGQPLSGLPAALRLIVGGGTGDSRTGRAQARVDAFQLDALGFLGANPAHVQVAELMGQRFKVGASFRVSRAVVIGIAANDAQDALGDVGEGCIAFGLGQRRKRVRGVVERLECGEALAQVAQRHGSPEKGRPGVQAQHPDLACFQTSREHRQVSGGHVARREQVGRHQEQRQRRGLDRRLDLVAPTRAGRDVALVPEFDRLAGRRELRAQLVQVDGVSRGAQDEHTSVGHEHASERDAARW